MWRPGDNATLQVQQNVLEASIARGGSPSRRDLLNPHVDCRLRRLRLSLPSTSFLFLSGDVLLESSCMCPGLMERWSKEVHIGEALTDVMKCISYYSEVLKEIILCETCGILIPPYLAPTPHPYFLLCRHVFAMIGLHWAFINANTFLSPVLLLRPSTLSHLQV